VTLPEKIYTERDISRARKKGKAIGWIQGGGVVIAGGLVLNLLGWIPTILVMVVVAYGLFRLLSKKPSKSEDDDS
jgi:hypothetical protein